MILRRIALAMLLAAGLTASCRYATVPCPLAPAQKACWSEQTGPSNGATDLPATTIRANWASLSYQHLNGPINSATFPIVNGVRTLANAWVEGCIEVDHPVLIYDVLLDMTDLCYGGNNQAGGSGINNGNAGDLHMDIGSVEVNGAAVAGDVIGISSSNYACNRCDVHDTRKGWWAGASVLIEDSYGHDMGDTGSNCDTGGGGIHGEIINADSSDGVTVRHSYLIADGDPDCITGAVAFNTTWSGSVNGTITDSYLEGRNGSDISFGPVRNINTTVADNVLHSLSSNFIAWFWWCESSNTTTGNVDENGALVPIPTSGPCPTFLN